MNVTECNNPFCLGPIESQAQFFGREAETRNTLNSLHNGQCVSVVGPAKIGKTSFLFHVAHPHVRARRGRAEEHVFVYVDGRSMAGFSERVCYLYIREEAIRQIKRKVAVDRDVRIQLEEVVRQVGLQTAYLGLRTLLRSAQRLGLQLVIVLDHLDVLNQNRLLEPAFFSAMRSLHTNYAVAYLVASQSPIDELKRICPNGRGSPFFNIFQPIPIDLFLAKESRQLVVDLRNLVGAGFPELVVDCILELGNNRPHRLQRAGHIACQIWMENQQDLCDEHCEEIRRRFNDLRS